MNKFVFLFKLIIRLIVKRSSTYFSVVEEVCKTALKRNPNDSPVKLFLGDLYVQHNRNKEAIAVLESLLESGKENKKVISRLSRAYFNSGEYSNVIRVLGKLDKISEKQNITYYLGFSLIELGKIEEGIEHLKGYLKHHPKDYMVLWKIGYEYFRQGKYDLALEAYQQAAKLNPSEERIGDAIDKCVEKMKNTNKLIPIH